MKSAARVAFIVLCLSVVAFFAYLKSGAMPLFAQTAPATGATAKEACLKCHGPYDKLAGAPAAYAAPSGEKINPHVYVPHSSKEAKAVPECTNCHQPHALPPNKAQIKSQPAPEVQWCFTACHHDNNFQPCQNCHKDMKPAQ